MNYGRDMYSDGYTSCGCGYVVQNDGGTVNPNPTDPGGNPAPGGSGGALFLAYSAALAATVDPAIKVISVVNSNVLLNFVENTQTSKAALTTADGRRWIPAGVVTPLHFGCAGNGTTDDTTRFQAALNYFVVANNPSDSWKNSGMRVLEGVGKQYATSAPVVLGNVGQGAGPIHNLKIQNLTLKAGPGIWTDLLGGIPGFVFVAAWRQALNPGNDVADNLYRIIMENVQIDCGFQTGGIFLENTDSNVYRDVRIDRLGKNKQGFRTSRSRANETGFTSKNGALLLSNIFVQVYENSTAPAEMYPPGEDQMSMNTTAIWIESNDFRMENCINNTVSRSWYFNNCGAGQIFDSHPWARSVEVGENCANLMFCNNYFDYTMVTLKSFNHSFVGNNWMLGDPDRGLRLEAQAPNSDGNGLVLTGNKFQLGMSIVFAVNAATGGSWVDGKFHKIRFVGNRVADPNYAWRERFGENLSIDNLGVVRVRPDDVTKGQTEFYGGLIMPGQGRTTNGVAGLELHSDNTGVSSGLIWQLGSGALQICNKRNLNINIGPDVAQTALQIQGSGAIAINAQMSLNVAPTIAAHAVNKNYVDTAVSDERLKENIQDIGSVLNSLLGLRVTTFNYRDINQNAELGNVPGLIAQEAKEIFPFAVRNRLPERILNEDGSVTEIEDALGVDYKLLVPVLIKAVQELTARVNTLENQGA